VLPKNQFVMKRIINIFILLLLIFSISKPNFANAYQEFSGTVIVVMPMKTVVSIDLNDCKDWKQNQTQSYSIRLLDNKGIIIYEEEFFSSVINLESINLREKPSTLILEVGNCKKEVKLKPQELKYK